MRRLVILGAILAGASPAWAVGPGDSCELTEAIRGAPQIKRWRKKSKVFRSGEVLEVTGKSRGYLKATVEGKSYYFKASALQSFCQPRDEGLPLAEPSSGAGRVQEADGTAADGGTETDGANSTASLETDGGNDDLFGDTIKIKVAVLDIRSDSLEKEQRDALTQTLAETLDGFGAFKTISTRDIASMLAYEAQKQILSCSDDSCIAEIGAALGADLLVSGSIVDIGGTWKLQLQLSNIQRGSVEQRASREYAGDTSGLFAEIRAAAAILVRDILGERSGTLAVAVNEVGASVKVDGAIVGVTPLEPMELAGGVHTVEVEKTGFVVFKQDVKIQANRESQLSATLIPSPDFIRKYEKDAGFTRTMAWVGLGVGALALGAAGGAYFVGGQEADDLNAEIAAYNQQPLRSTAEEERLQDREATVGMWDTVAVVSAGIGVAALATGIVLYVTGDDPDRYEGLASTSSDDAFFAGVGLGTASFGFNF